MGCMNHPFLRRHLDTLLALALAVTVFGVYLHTLCPTLYWGDCGELATVVSILGIPHPTGYPLYCLLGKAWTLLLPVGSLVWRLNVLSAVFGALAVACCYGFARAAGLPRPLALTAGGLLAFSSTFWQQALITETYTLAAFFTSLLLFLAVRWRARGCRSGDLRMLALAYGFALTSHQSNTLFLPGFVAFVLWSAPALRRWKDREVSQEWAKTLGSGALPLLTYLYLPLRARTHPAYNWGDPETLSALYYHVTGRLFAPLMFHQKPEFVLDRLAAWSQNLPMEFSWLLVTAAAVGLALFWRRRADRPLALLLTWMFVADLGFVVNYAIYNGYIYFIPSYIVMSVCAGRGLLGLWHALEPRLEQGRRPVFAALGVVCALALVPVQAIGHRGVSLSGNWTCEDYGRNLLASVPPHGILIENGDNTAAPVILYLQIVQGVRPDVVLVRRDLLSGIYDSHSHSWANFWYFDDLKRRYPHVQALYPAQGISAPQASAEDPLRRIIRDAAVRGVPVGILDPAGGPAWFCDLPLIADDDGRRVRLDIYLNRHYDTSLVGMVTRVYGRGRRPAAPALHAETERIWQSYSLRGVFDGKLQSDRFLLLLALNYGNGTLARADLAYSQGDYAVAEASYTDVLSLFACDAATQGLQRCALARHRNANVVSARNSPLAPGILTKEKTTQ